MSCGRCHALFLFQEYWKRSNNFNYISRQDMQGISLRFRAGNFLPRIRKVEPTGEWQRIKCKFEPQKRVKAQLFFVELRLVTKVTLVTPTTSRRLSWWPNGLCPRRIGTTTSDCWSQLGDRCFDQSSVFFGNHSIMQPLNGIRIAGGSEHYQFSELRRSLEYVWY